MPIIAYILLFKEENYFILFICLIELEIELGSLP